LVKISRPPIDSAVSPLPVKNQASRIVSSVAMVRQVKILVAVQGGNVEKRRPSAGWGPDQWRRDLQMRVGPLGLKKLPQSFFSLRPSLG